MPTKSWTAFRTGNMSVKFETQREFKDKNRDDRKETLDILIRDAPASAIMNCFPAARPSASILPSAWRSAGCWPTAPGPACKPW